jgi:nitrite reductase/ring-hydroxylating ferredoxin subunit
MQRKFNPVPAEGDNNLFTQSWFAVALSEEVVSGKILGRRFLDGKVILVRDEQGHVQAFSGYCVHLGTDLSNGEVVSGNVRCPLHHWIYDTQGQCVATGCGDKAPPTARLFQFPTTERYGIIWLFNGETPLWEIENFSKAYRDEELIVRARKDKRTYPVDPWVIRSNTPDWQHLAFVHHMKMDVDIRDKFQFEPYGLQVQIPVGLEEGSGQQLEYNIRVSGTSLWTTAGRLSGKWHLQVSALGIEAPGTSTHYYSHAVHRGDGSDAAERRARELIDELEFLFEKVLDEDMAVMTGMHYRPGLLTASDGVLATYLDYVRRFPRAHPSREFIR